MSSLSLTFLSFAFYLFLHFTIFFLSFLSMHADSDFDSMTTNNLRDSPNGTFVTSDDSSLHTATPTFCHLETHHEKVAPVTVCEFVVSAALVVLSLVNGLAWLAAPYHTQTDQCRDHCAVNGQQRATKKGKPFTMTSNLRWSVT